MRGADSLSSSLEISEIFETLKRAAFFEHRNGRASVLGGCCYSRSGDSALRAREQPEQGGHASEAERGRRRGLGMQEVAPRPQTLISNDVVSLPFAWSGVFAIFENLCTRGCTRACEKAETKGSL